jgi:hypothetical protein
MLVAAAVGDLALEVLAGLAVAVAARKGLFLRLSLGLLIQAVAAVAGIEQQILVPLAALGLLLYAIQTHAQMPQQQPARRRLPTLAGIKSTNSLEAGA